MMPRMRRRLPAVLWVWLVITVVARGAPPPLPPVEIVPDVTPGVPSVARVTRLTSPPKHHFVGYYGITPLDASGVRLACLESDVGDRLVQATDRAPICLVDTSTQQLTRVAETSAWNLQQGAMLHWLPTAPDRELIFNDRIDGRLVSVVLDVKTNRRRVLDRPLAAVSHDGKTGISLNYDRLRQIRPVTGYAGGDATIPLVPRPADDGLFLVDLATGISKLLVSVDQACRTLAPPEAIQHQPFWLEHAHFSRGGSRVFLLARAFDPKSRQLVSLPLTVAPNGEALRALLPWAVQGASHFDWLDDRRLVHTREHAPTKWHHLLIDTAASDDAKPKILAADVLTRDGHCTFSPDGRWMVTDTYPDEHRRQHLFLLNVATGVAARVASFHTPPEYRGDWRCDLHPRWSRDGRQICIDSTHEGLRQVYVIDLNVPG
jgi:hypothetical protein